MAMKPKLKQELARLKELGVIKAVYTTPDWVPSLVLLKKSNGKLRVFIDPQPLNEALPRNAATTYFRSLMIACRTCQKPRSSVCAMLKTGFGTSSWMKIQAI